MPLALFTLVIFGDRVSDKTFKKKRERDRVLLFAWSSILLFLGFLPLLRW
jgi:hypothetical protein